MRNPELTTKRILRVNHAGEYGAIRIYKAQILLSRILYPDLTTHLTTILAHEIDHCRRFAAAMQDHNVRPCHTMWFWSYGGTILGALTALLGRNMIMVCTEAVEHAVHHHMTDQKSFLHDHYPTLHTLITEIQQEEEAHLSFAQTHVRHNRFTKRAACLIASLTEIVIFLSTRGDSARMKNDLKATAR